VIVRVTSSGEKSNTRHNISFHHPPLSDSPEKEHLGILTSERNPSVGPLSDVRGTTILTVCEVNVFIFNFPSSSVISSPRLSLSQLWESQVRRGRSRQIPPSNPLHRLCLLMSCLRGHSGLHDHVYKSRAPQTDTLTFVYTFTGTSTIPCHLKLISLQSPDTSDGNFYERVLHSS